MLWQIRSEGRFYDAHEETVIYYDPNSGDTHLLTDLAAFVVEQIAQGTGEEAGILKALAPHLEGEDVDATELLSGVLQELSHLDIAQPA